MVNALVSVIADKKFWNHMIEVEKYSGLSEKIKEKLNSHISNEFGHIPIVNETEWATPDWTILYYENGLIATFYNIVETKIIIDGNEFKVGGVNNVITPIEFRGKGYATKILKQAERLIFEDLNCDLGALLCADNLVPFYQRLNWYKVDCPVYFNQSSGIKLWQSNTMLLTKKQKINPKKIELNGLPW